MKIGIASDHRGYNLKQEVTNYLKEQEYTVIDYGTNSEDSVDYPDYAEKVSKSILTNEIDFGITICGTGIGMSIACNKVKGIRCAKIDNEYDAMYAKKHNNANVIAFSSNKNKEEIIKMVNSYMISTFSNEEKEIRRLKKIEDIENEY